MRAISALTLTLFIASVAYAQQGDNDARQLELQLMKTTQVVAIANYSGAPDKFVEDSDPNTLEIVTLAKPEFGPSRVSDDGEVIYFAPGASEDEQTNLFTKAFDIRTQRRLAAQKSD